MLSSAFKKYVLEDVLDHCTCKLLLPPGRPTLSSLVRKGLVALDELDQ